VGCLGGTITAFGSIHALPSPYCNRAAARRSWTSWRTFTGRVRRTSIPSVRRPQPRSSRSSAAGLSSYSTVTDRCYLARRMWGSVAWPGRSRQSGISLIVLPAPASPVGGPWSLQRIVGYY